MKALLVLMVDQAERATLETMEWPEPLVPQEHRGFLDNLVSAETRELAVVRVQWDKLGLQDLKESQEQEEALVPLDPRGPRELQDRRVRWERAGLVEKTGNQEGKV